MAGCCAAAARRFAAQLDPGLAAWIEAEVAFPCTMVDSITPATTPALVQRVTTELGMEDRWPVQRESFVQWVVEEHEALESPDWARAGVTLTDDVSGYERAKLRLLNGAHSTLAYVGMLRGHETVADAMRDTALSAFVRRPHAQGRGARHCGPFAGSTSMATSKRCCGGSRIRRFATSSRRSRGTAARSSRYRIIGTIRDALAAGGPIERPCVTLAAWMHFVRRREKAGIVLVDPLAEHLAHLARGRTTGDATTDVGVFLSLHEMFPRDLAADVRFRDTLERAYNRLAAVPSTLLT